jgi:DNA primase
MGKPYIDFAAVKAAVNMTQILERYGLLAGMRSTRNGDGFEGRCPIHKGSSDDQFKVSVSKNCWNCFGSECQCGGNVLDFVAKMEKVDALEAAHLLNGWFVLGLEKQAAPPREERGPKDHKSGGQKEGESNGIRESVKDHGSTRAEENAPEEIGANDPLKFELKNLKADHPYFGERGLTAETVSAFGLGYCAKGTMSGRVVIPIHNAKSELVGYVGRWPGQPPDERPKYKLPTGFHKMVEVFNLHRAIREPTEEPLIVVEGFFDVMLLWQQGYRRVVSLMGSSLSAVQEQLIAEAESKSSGIILMFDEDAAGRTGRDKALCRLAKSAFVRVAVLPREGAQPDHLTAEELRNLLQ